MPPARASTRPTLVDEVSLEERAGAHLLRLEKRVAVARPETHEPA